MPERSDIEALKTHILDSQEQIKDLQASHAKMKDKWYVKLGSLIDSFFKWILIAGGLAIVLRVASLLVKGPAGSVMAYASTGILGVLSGGISLIQAAADNVWARKVKPKQDLSPGT